MSDLLGLTPGSTSLIRGHLDQICRGTNFARARALLAGQIFEVSPTDDESLHGAGSAPHTAWLFQPQSRMGFAAAAAARRQAGHAVFCDVLTRIRNLVKRYPAMRHAHAAGLRRGSHPDVESLDVWTAVQSLLDAAVVQRCVIDLDVRFLLGTAIWLSWLLCVCATKLFDGTCECEKRFVAGHQVRGSCIGA